MRWVLWGMESRGKKWWRRDFGVVEVGEKREGGKAVVSFVCGLGGDSG